MTASDPRAAGTLRVWFRGEPRDKRWFEKDPAFDADVRDGFLSLYEEAAAGRLSGCQDGPGDCLALIVLLDQRPRNMFRGTPRAFAADALALSAAKHAVERGYDRGMKPEERMFVYLPFEHAE